AQMDRRDLAGECMRAFQASSGGTGRARHGPGGASVAAWGDDRGWPGEEVGGICQTSVMARLMLLDTASLYFRAFFGVPDSLRAPDGTPVNAVRGLLDFIARLTADYQ